MRHLETLYDYPSVMHSYRLDYFLEIDLVAAFELDQLMADCYCFRLAVAIFVQIAFVHLLIAVYRSVEMNYKHVEEANSSTFYEMVESKECSEEIK